MLVSCEKNTGELTNGIINYNPPFYAEFDNVLTKTYVNDSLQLHWNANDKLSVFTSTTNQMYQFDGNTGDSEGTFSVVETENKSICTSLSVDANYAVYPYSEETTISSDGSLTFTLPQTQVYTKSSFGINSNPMVAVTENKNDTYLSFKNICGYLRLYLYGDGIIAKSIRLEGNSNEFVSGKAKVTISYGQNPIISLADGASHSITLDCHDGVQIGESATEATELWFVIPPVTFENGFTIIIEDINGNKYTKSTENKIEIMRNVVSNMAASKIEYKLEYQLFEKEFYGIDAAMTPDGNYCALIEVNNESKQKLAILGNTNTESRDYVLLDSLGIIHNFTLGTNVYSLTYGEDNVSVFCNDSWECDIPYEKFYDFNDNIQTRASFLTRNPIYKLASKIFVISDFIKAPRKAIILAVLHSQLGDDDELLNLLVDAIDGIDILEAIKWIDHIMDINYFGDAYISTLEPHKIAVCNYDLGCYTRLPYMDTPFYKENSYRGVSYTFKVSMKLREDCIGGEEYSKESEALDEYTWFNFQDLELNTEYIYEPKLEVEYSISDEAYWLSIGEDPQKIGPQKARRILYGKERSFTTGSVSTSVENIENVKYTTADVICSFSDVPKGAECEVLINEEGTDVSMVYSGQPNSNNQKVSVTGLRPFTTYRVSSRIIYKGRPYNSKYSHRFTTIGPSGYIKSIKEYQNSADITCVFNNLESGVDCGIIVEGRDGFYQKLKASNTEKEQTITISGLSAAIWHLCKVYVSYSSYYCEGQVKEFRTLTADITGTWYTPDHTIILNADGTAESSSSKEPNSIYGEWRFDGHNVNIFVGDIYTEWPGGHEWGGREWNGTVNDRENPTKIVGRTGRWAGSGNAIYTEEVVLTR